MLQMVVKWRKKLGKIGEANLQIIQQQQAYTAMCNKHTIVCNEYTALYSKHTHLCVNSANE